jgi:flavin-dependent dehydrogenase
MIFDLAIIGGGPAGCAAAIIAARNGARVVLLERGKLPRHRVCGEFVSAESLELLNDLLGSEFERLMLSAPQISQARVFADGRVVQARIFPSAASISRFDLDAAVWKACVACGVEAPVQSAVRNLSGRGPFHLTANHEVFEARAVINAGGRWSNFTSSTTRACVTSEKWIGIKGHFIEEAGSDSVDLYFFDGGYCGVQPIEICKSGFRRVNACAMVRADVASTMGDILKQHKALHSRSQYWGAATDSVTTSPLIFHEPEPFQGIMLQAGDAAMFVDPFVGDGISLALRSGSLAAKSLLPFFRDKISLAHAGEAYSREYLRRFGRVFTNSSRLRGLMRWPQIIRKPVLSALAKAPIVTNQLVRMTR